MRWLSTLSRSAERAALGIAVAGIVVMVAAVLVQIVGRYVFAQPPFWTEELARYAMIWAGCMGSTVAFRRMADPRIVELPDTSGRSAVRIVASALGLGAAGAFAGPVLWHALFGPGMDATRGHLARSARRSSEALGVPMSVVATAVALMMALVLLHALAMLLEATRGATQPRTDPEGTKKSLE